MSFFDEDPKPHPEQEGPRPRPAKPEEVPEHVKAVVDAMERARQDSEKRSSQPRQIDPFFQQVVSHTAEFYASIGLALAAWNGWGRHAFGAPKLRFREAWAILVCIDVAGRSFHRAQLTVIEQKSRLDRARLLSRLRNGQLSLSDLAAGVSNRGESKA